jgi:hypothetical protein
VARARSVEPKARRRLSQEDSRELIQLLDAVPADADAEDARVRDVLAYFAALDIPGHMRVSDHRLRLGGSPAALLEQIRAVATCIDFGRDPTLPCDCGGCGRRQRLGPYHTIEEYKRLGLFCERAAQW